MAWSPRSWITELQHQPMTNSVNAMSSSCVPIVRITQPSPSSVGSTSCHRLYSCLIALLWAPTDRAGDICRPPGGEDLRADGAVRHEPLFSDARDRRFRRMVHARRAGRRPGEPAVGRRPRDPNSAAAEPADLDPGGAGVRARPHRRGVRRARRAGSTRWRSTGRRPDSPPEGGRRRLRDHCGPLGRPGSATSAWRGGDPSCRRVDGSRLPGPGPQRLAGRCRPATAYGRACGFERAMDNLGAIIGPILAIVLVGAVGIRWAIAWRDASIRPCSGRPDCA